MKTTLLVSLLALGFVTPAFAAEPSTTAATVIGHATVDQAFAQGGMLYPGRPFRIMAGRRDAQGPVEIHAHDTDIFYITQGSATLMTGGTAVNKTQIGPGEYHADKIVDGTTQPMTKGDVVVIPAGVPHWILHPSKPFLYFVVKVRTK